MPAMVLGMFFCECFASLARRAGAGFTSCSHLNRLKEPGIGQPGSSSDCEEQTTAFWERDAREWGISGASTHGLKSHHGPSVYVNKPPILVCNRRSVRGSITSHCCSIVLPDDDDDDDRFHIVPFSALEKTHCAFVAYDPK